MSTSSISKPAILVTGATGQQGGATINALIEAGALKTHSLIAVTRNRESGAAKKLEARGVKLIQGDLSDCPLLFNKARAVLGGGKDVRVWGVFSVQPLVGDAEETQGKALVDAALANQVELFVYTSVDRGGEARSPSNPTNVPHFITKHNIEKYLLAQSKAHGDKMKWVILRPVAFMENMVPGFPGKLMGTAFRVILGKKPLQLIATRDIGWYAARALLRPDEFAGRSISLAGDELNFAQVNALFKSEVGQELPQTMSFLARLIMWLAKDLGAMIRWFAAEGYGADVKALREEHPDLQSFRDWLRESAWVAKSSVKDG
ncbi:hypothetical protein BP5796_01178 [Coleophoma crateriformis]|uniref:NmrA-like domain-containing protein n=1 Tax=Coleophoma crateriformis TaxID=565419 RepID=A0A3D8SZR4_9HELO|nr:hypothetical protein BP5796_01178 [Coleophoma crateriformis]